MSDVSDTSDTSDTVDVAPSGGPNGRTVVLLHGMITGFYWELVKFLKSDIAAPTQNRQ